jgi:hypothetical protein
MAHVINTTNIHMTDFIQDRPGQFRAIVKVKAGFFTIVDDLGIQCNWKTGARWKRGIDVFRNFQKGALQTIEFKAEGSDNWLTVFGRSGKTIKLMDRQLFEDMEVGDINQIWSNTNLYDQKQYGMVNAKSWASKAFVMNASTETVAA